VAKFCPYCGIGTPLFKNNDECNSQAPSSSKSNSHIKRLLIGAGIIINIGLIALVGFSIMKSEQKKHWDREAYRIFMELEPYQDEIFIDSIMIIDDWWKNIGNYNSFSEADSRRYRRYKAAERYIYRRILNIAPQYGIREKNSDELEVKAEIFYRVMSLCGSSYY